MGFFDQFSGSPVRGLLGDDGARAFDPNWMRDSLAENAMTPKPEKKGPNFGKILGTIGEGLLTAAATYGMSPYEAARFGQMRAENKRENQKLKQQQALMQQAFGAIDADPNMTPQERALAKVNVEEYQKRWAEQYGTHSVNAGDSLVRGVGGGARDVFVAPKTFQEGADVAQTAPQSFQIPQSAPMLPGATAFGGGSPLDSGAPAAGPPGMMGSGGPDGRPPVAGLNGRLRTQAEQYADSLGIDRGSSEWGSAVRDYTLKEYGPTANSEKRTLKSWDLGQSDTNNRRTTDASRYSTDTSRDNRNNTPAATVLNERGEVVLAYPNNRVTTLTNSQPVPTARPGRGTVAPRTGAAQAAEGTVIRHPRTGQRMVMRGGKWTKL